MTKQPPKCDREVWEKGVAVLVTHTFDSWTIENWVKKVAETSGQRVDWSWMGGRAVIRALGDIGAVYRALEAELAQKWGEIEVSRVIREQGPDALSGRPRFYDLPWMIRP